MFTRPYPIVVALAASACGQSGPSAKEFAGCVEEVVASYPTDGTHEYWWPKQGTWAGVTRDLRYVGEVIAKGDPKGRCYCCGLTFEVFFRSWDRWSNTRKRPFRIGELATAEAVARLRKQWFGTDGNRQTMVHAITANGLGHRVESLADALPGDFVQFWRAKGSGHSVVFRSWVRDADRIVGLHYWSTQKATSGIGERVERFDGDNAIDPNQVWIARVGRIAPREFVRVVSFNVRRGLADDGENGWDKRRDLVIETVRRHDADLIGFQEMLPGQRRNVARALTGFDVVDGNAERGDFANLNPIFVRRDRFEIVEQWSFWLSETPDRPLSKSWGARWPRQVTWVKLRDKHTGKRLVHVNSHFDNVGSSARLESAKLVAKRAEKTLGDLPRVLTGDLNSYIDRPPLQHLRDGGWRDAFRDVWPDARNIKTIHHFTGNHYGPRKIDYVLRGPRLRTLRAGIDRSGRDGRWPSDHFPVWADLTWRK